jgi:hypothetical protein
VQAARVQVVVPDIFVSMLDSPVLDVAFGIIFVFYAIALVCAGAAWR